MPKNPKRFEGLSINWATPLSIAGWFIEKGKSDQPKWMKTGATPFMETTLNDGEQSSQPDEQSRHFLCSTRVFETNSWPQTQLANLPMDGSTRR